MDPHDYPCSVCWQHAEEWCPLCDPDPEEELRVVQELADRMFEQGGFDFTTASPPAACEGGSWRPVPLSRGAHRRAECQGLDES